MKKFSTLYSHVHKEFYNNRPETEDIRPENIIDTEISDMLDQIEFSVPESLMHRLYIKIRMLYVKNMN